MTSPTSHSHSHSHTHYDWLQLIEVSGPFLSATVLNEAFPDGLDGFDKRTKRDLSHFYSEWVEAFETRHADFPALHDAWIRSVLRDGLQFRDGDLSPGAEWSVAGEGGLGRFAPDYALKDMDAKPALFIKILPADVKPDARDVADDWKDSVIEKMTRLCRANEVRIGLVTNGEKWVLVNAATGGTLSGTATWYARLWFQEDSTLRAFLALLGYRRFVGAPKKRLPYLLDESLKHLEEVTDTLGKQVMTAVEVLMEGFDRADLASGRKLLAGVSPSALYEAALTVMMRLVFLLCAEERGLMLLGEKKYDDVYAVSTLRKKLEEESDKFGPQVLERRYDAWARLLGVFRLVYGGISHPDLLFPAMGGSLFNPEKFPFLEGRQLGLSMTDDNPPPLPIDNRTVLLILESLQVLKQKGGAIPLSFRSLDVEQIGYIYEGLLEFTGARADELLLGVKGDKTHQNPEIALAELESLALDSEEKLFARMKDLTGRTAIAREYAAEPDITLLPFLSKICRGDKKLEARILPYLNWLRTSEWGEPVVYHKDSFYVTEGRDRRSSGTHYTPKPLTEMIVKEALEPVVYDGPAKGTPRAEWKLKSPDELLSLKICDPAMGSGAFLVQACRYLGDRLVESWAAAEKVRVDSESEREVRVDSESEREVRVESEGEREALPTKPLPTSHSHSHLRAIDSQGRVVDYPAPDPMSEVLEDRLCEARRLVAERCLYGVDINPLAVELAKLSLWLVTISKGRPFGFLDHNLKSGDSLLGVSDIEQLAQFRMKPDPHGNLSLLSGTIRAKVAEALKEREEIREMRMRDITDVRLAETKNAKVETMLSDVRDYADYFIGEVLVAGKPTKKTAARLDAAAVEGEPLLGGDAFKAAILKKQTAANLAYDLPAGQTAPRRPFHWAIEFPEVFSSRAVSLHAASGFDAIVGNPPFMGGKHITGNFGTAYRDYMLYHIANGVKGSADLVAYFYLRAYLLLCDDGDFGLIACNTIAEGDTRQVGLERMVKTGGTIYSANPNMPWPGTAAVVISPVFVMKGPWQGKKRLCGNEVEMISPFLSGQDEWSPRVLGANASQSFQGSVVLGLGFTMSEEDAQNLIKKDPKNAEVLFPYLNGDDLNSNPTQKPSRWVINFFDWPVARDASGMWESAGEKERKAFYNVGHVPIDYPGRVVNDFVDLYQLLYEKVRPERQRLDENGEYVLRRPLPIRWWQYADKRPALYHSIGRGASFARHPEGWETFKKSSKVIVVSLVQSYLKFCLVPNDAVFAHKLAVIVRENVFPVLSSLIFNVWARSTSSTMGFGINFSPSDSYETFPFPVTISSALEELGEKYDAIRRQIMTSRNIGLTALYNLFHDPTTKDSELEEMRKLQREIDEAVRDAYGWSDIDLGHGFHEVGYLPANDNVRYTISEPARIEILKRLSALNRQRWEEEEKAGLHKKGKN